MSDIQITEKLLLNAGGWQALRWDFVVHVAKDFPRTVRFLLPDKQVLAAEINSLPVSRHVPFENRGRNRDVIHHVDLFKGAELYAKT